MPRKVDMTNPYAAYPQWFMQIAEAMQHRKPLLTATVGPRNKAINFRQRFHTFRRQMTQDGHPWNSAMWDYTLSLALQADGRTSITFSLNEVQVEGVLPQPQVPREQGESHEHAMLQQEADDIKPEGYADKHADRDNFEEEVVKWMRGDSGAKK